MGGEGARQEKNRDRRAPPRSPCRRNVKEGEMGRLDSWRVSTRIQLLVGLMLLGLLALCVVALA